MIGITHPLGSLALQITLGLLTGNYWYGVASSLMFVGRESAQAEYRWIERYGFGRRANMPWWGRFDRRVWDVHSMTDWLLPIIFTTVVAVLVQGV